MVVRGAQFASRAIEGFGGGWPSHMANMLADGSFWDARDDFVQYEGIPYEPGVQHRPAGYLQAAYARWAIFEAPAGSESAYDKWVATLGSQGGKTYDQIGIRDFAEGLLTGQYKDRNWGPLVPSQSKAWFCDDYSVWAAGTNAVLPWPIPIPIFTFTPGAALNLFIGAGWKLTESKGLSFL